MDMKLYILRHGETDLNVQGRLQGWLDAPLNENGVRAAAETSPSFPSIAPHRQLSRIIPPQSQSSMFPSPPEYVYGPNA